MAGFMSSFHLHRPGYRDTRTDTSSPPDVLLLRSLIYMAAELVAPSGVDVDVLRQMVPLEVEAAGDRGAHCCVVLRLLKAPLLDREGE